MKWANTVKDFNPVLELFGIFLQNVHFSRHFLSLACDNFYDLLQSLLEMLTRIMKIIQQFTWDRIWEIIFDVEKFEVMSYLISKHIFVLW